MVLYPQSNPGYKIGNNPIGDRIEIVTINPTALLDSEGKGKYSTSEFTWENPVGL